MSSSAYFLSLLPIVVLLSLGARRAKRRGRWTSPDAFFAMVWGLLLAASAILVPGYELGLFGLTLIFLIIGAFLVGTYVASPPQSRVAIIGTVNPWTARRQSLALLAGILGLVALAGPVSILHSDGQSIGSALHLSQLFTAASENTSLRYNSANFRGPIVAQLAFPCYLAGASLSGVAWASGISGWRRKALSLVPFLPAIWTMLLETTRVSLILPIVAWISWYLAVKVGDGKARYRRLWQSMAWFLRWAVVAICAGSVLVIGYAVRTGLHENQSQLRSTLASDALGAPSAFTVWAQDQGNRILVPQTYGSRTLSGPIGLLFHRPAATNTDIVVGSQTSYSSDTTQRTMFGDGIRDYSLEGSFLLAAIAGFVAQRAFFKASSRSVAGVALLAAVYGCILFGTAGFMFTWTIEIFGWLLATALLWLVQKRVRVSTRHDNRSSVRVVA